jgi:hypothetical protein
VVERAGHGRAVVLGQVCHALPLGDVLPDQPVGVLVGAPLPGMMGGRELEARLGLGLEGGIAVELFEVDRSPVPGARG